MTTENEELIIKFEDFDKICRFCYKRSHYLRSIFEEVDEKPDAELMSNFNEMEDMVALLDTNLGLKVIQLRLCKWLEGNIIYNQRYIMVTDCQNVFATIATNNSSSATSSENSAIQQRFISIKFG